MKSFKIVITFFLLWLSIQFNSEIENIIAYISIFTLGILHGANDIHLIETGNKRLIKTRARLIFAYVTMVLLIVLIFYFIPIFALITFVILSGFHFGEEHWNDHLESAGKEQFLFYTSYGLFIIFLIFYLNSAPTTLIIETITGYGPQEGWYGIGVAVTLVVTSLFLCYYRKQLSWTTVIKEILYVLIFYVVFKMTTLLLSFAIYFVIWHSIPSINNQIGYLYGTVNSTTLIKYLKTSFIYWFFSILGILLLYIFFWETPYVFNAIFFAFLAAITFPHVWVINSVKKMT